MSCPASGRGAVEIADDAAGVVFRRHHFDLHDRLEQHRPPFCSAFAERRARRDFEGQRVRVDVVVGLPSISVALKSITGKPARRRLSLRLEALFDAGMNSFGTEPPTTFVLEHEAGAGGSGSKSIVTSANWPEPPVCFLWV
jgi:hypothetical protein